MLNSLQLLNPIWKPWKTLLASVIRAKNTAPEKKPADRSNAARSGGRREKKVHKALCSDRANLCTAPNPKIQLKFVKHVWFCVVFFSTFDLCVLQYSSRIHQCWWSLNQFSEISADVTEINISYMYLIRFSNFLRFRRENMWTFQKLVFKTFFQLEKNRA